MSKIAITMGDPSGIGPEIIIKALNTLDCSNIVLIGNREVFEKTAAAIMLELPVNIKFIDIPFDISTLEMGKDSSHSGDIAFKCLEKACDMAKNNEISSIVTAPLSKTAINMAGYNYSGQTEILEEKLATEDENRAEMLFAACNFRVMLLTRHLKLTDVAASLTIDGTIDSIKVLDKSLKNKFKTPSPRIAICGLNPHAGEDGLLGTEEKEIIIPAINKLKEKGINVDGPFPADTLFVKAGRACVNNVCQPYDCYVACYHDQGLTPIKMVAMDKTVNVTIGLPVLRTSPAHGTAFDIAGQNKADYRSMLEAIKLVL